MAEVRLQRHRLADRRRKWAYTPNGVPVWTIIAEFKAAECDAASTSAAPDDLRFALEYYVNHQAEIDQKLASL